MTWDGRWRAPGSLLVDLRPPRERGVFCEWPEDPKLIYEVRVVLTIAHLNHRPGDDRDENLAAWCQYDHLLYDVPHHAVTRAAHKDERRPLLADALLQGAYFSAGDYNFFNDYPRKVIGAL